ncbi:MAG: recombination regulator RecX [Burkholderiaceae bacterium]|jgi:regulatory protein
MVRAAQSLLSRGVALLARREHSRLELSRKLAPHAESPEQLTEVLNRLSENGLLSDARFAEALVRVRGQSYGLARLRGELSQKGVNEAQAEAALDEARQSESSRHFAVWQKRFGQPPSSLPEKAKQQRFMAARGFSPELYRALERRGFQSPESDF